MAIKSAYRRLYHDDEQGPETMKMKTETLAWHFVGDKLRDGRPTPKDGELLTHYDYVRVCSSGLHASERVIDALQYAPAGSKLCRVVSGGIESRETDKFAGRRRKILWRIEIWDLVEQFARDCINELAPLWNPSAEISHALASGPHSEKDRLSAYEAVSGVMPKLTGYKFTAAQAALYLFLPSYQTTERLYNGIHYAAKARAEYEACARTPYYEEYFATGHERAKALASGYAIGRGVSPYLGSQNDAAMWKKQADYIADYESRLLIRIEEKRAADVQRLLEIGQNFEAAMKCAERAA